MTLKRTGFKELLVAHSMMMYAFSNHNAKGFYTDLFEEALAGIVDIIDVKEAYTHFQYREQRRGMVGW